MQIFLIVEKFQLKISNQASYYSTSIFFHTSSKRVAIDHGELANLTNLGAVRYITLVFRGGFIIKDRVNCRFQKLRKNVLKKK